MRVKLESQTIERHTNKINYSESACPDLVFHLHQKEKKKLKPCFLFLFLVKYFKESDRCAVKISDVFRTAIGLIFVMRARNRTHEDGSIAPILRLHVLLVDQSSVVVHL